MIDEKPKFPWIAPTWPLDAAKAKADVASYIATAINAYDYNDDAKGEGDALVWFVDGFVITLKVDSIEKEC